MTEKEKELQFFIMDWNYNLKRIKTLKEQIAEMNISITQRLDIAGGGGGNWNTSKIEFFYLKKEKKELELKELQKKVDDINYVLESKLLKDVEKGTIRCIMKKESLSKYAEQQGIYLSYVYKIKENAIKKMAKHIS